MNRSAIALTVLAAILVAVLWYFFLFNPKSQELADVQAEAAAAREEQQQLRTQLESLRRVRENVPAIEAALAAYRALIPADPALPSFLRQIQTSADDSGLTLTSVAPSLPSPTEEVEGVQVINVTIEMEGGYFQVVDFLRRMEDPAIVARGVLVDGLNIDMEPEEYPVLTVSVTARMFTTAPPSASDAPAPEPTPTDEPSPGATETPDASAQETAQ